MNLKPANALKSKPHEQKAIKIVCVKWGDKFCADYVNILNNAVKRNISFPHRFFCLTENPVGLNPEIEIIKLQQDFEYCWNKLELFKQDNFSVDDLCLYFDLDVVIAGNIDDLLMFQPDDKFIGICDWYKQDRSVYNSSVMRFSGNSYTDLNKSLIDKLKQGAVRWGREYDEYLKSDDKVVLWEGRKKFRSDQEWISRHVYPKRKLKKHCFPEGWIMSYKKHGKKGLPEGCKVMVFHGYPKPHEVDDDYVKANWY